MVAASTADFTAQCYELYDAPPLGSLVKTAEESLELYGIVYNATTTSLDPGRLPVARGKDEASEEDIYRTNPQLQKLLRTEFSAVIVGFKQDGKMFRYLPPQPAHIHAFVHSCTMEEIKEFSRSLDFLSILVNSHLNTPVDELIAAALRQMAQSHEDHRAFLLAAGKEVAVLFGEDLNQLKSILGRIRP